MASSARTGRRGRGWWRRQSPFRNGQAHTLVHTAHHKSGTVWFRRVLEVVARTWGLPFAQNTLPPGPTSPLVFFQHRPFVDPRALAPCRGSHMVRDPRDVVVSGYHYHLWTGEVWANAPMNTVTDAARRFAGVPEDWRSRSFREYLNALSPAEGLAAEIRYAGFILEEIGAWNYHNPDILELRYEEVMQDQPTAFECLFRHYGFVERAVEEAVAIALTQGFERTSGRPVGQVVDNQHLRSGRSGQWRDIFASEHTALFKSLYGDLLIELGYERDQAW